MVELCCVTPGHSLADEMCNLARCQVSLSGKGVGERVEWKAGTGVSSVPAGANVEASGQLGNPTRDNNTRDIDLRGN